MQLFFSRVVRPKIKPQIGKTNKPKENPRKTQKTRDIVSCTKIFETEAEKQREKRKKRENQTEKEIYFKKYKKRD